jgi:hypothetical protein
VQLAYLQAIPGAAKGMGASLLVPRCAVLTLLPSAEPAIERAAFLLTWSASTTLFKLFKGDVSTLSLDSVEVASAAPVQFPVSNPIMTVRRLARNVFWQPPPHARAHPASADSVLPTGKGWLDHELREALRVAIPYLSTHSQHFWKGTAVPPPGGILVSGGRGAGKTALLERCAAALGEHPACMCHVSRMACREMAGDKPKKVRVLRLLPHNVQEYCVATSACSNTQQQVLLRPP